MVRCWCGNEDLIAFSPDYRRCAACETLVDASNAAAAGGFDPRVRDDARDFYGHAYWHAHQHDQPGHADILARVRTDLHERCAFWLNALLRFKLPPGRALELGSAHGGFVALLRQAGFDATGLELSPSIVQLARETFGVPMLTGPVEDQQLSSGTFDVVALMDVLEHLPDPLATMRRCLDLLADDGVLLVQTPCYPAGKSLDEACAAESRFAIQLRPREHLNLFSRRSVAEMFRRLGAPHVTFLPPIFWFYDMFLLVSRRPIVEVSEEERARAMSATVERRVVQALLDGEARFRELLERHRQSLAEIRALRGVSGSSSRAA